MHRRVALVACFASALLAACRPDAPGRAPAGPVAGPPVELAAIASRAHLAFRSDGRGGHEALAPGLRVQAAADGALLLGPTDPVRPVSAVLRLGPARLERLGEQALAETGPAEVDRGGALVRRHGRTAERLEAGPSGVALSWRLEARPAGQGDLEVHLPVAGLAFLGATPGGLHYGATGTPGLRIGHATWIDAAGKRTSLPARHLGGEVVLAVPAALLEASAYPAVLDPILSAESDLDVPVVAAAPGAQLAPAVATDGAGWLVAWADARALGESWVVAARLAADGTVLDPTGLVVAGGPGQRTAPAVAWGAGGWLVAWLEQASTSVTGLRAVPVGADGALAGLSALVDEGLMLPVATAAAFDGTAFRLAWSGFDADPDPRFRDCELRLATVDAAGQPVQAQRAFFDTCSAATRPALACEGDACLVAWPALGGLQVGRYGRAGQVLRPLLGAPGTGGASAPSATFTGAGYALAFQRPGPAADSPEVAALSVDLAGVPVGVAAPVSTGGRSASPSIAFDGAALVVAWEERKADGGDVYLRRLGLDGAPLDLAALAVATAAGPQGEPVVAAGPGGALVAFTDARLDPAGDVRAARVLPGDLVPDGEGLLLSRSATSERRPQVAFDGGRWLVVFEAARGPGLPTGVFGVRLGPGLAPEDSAPFLVSGGGGAALRPAVAGCGGHFVVAWEDYTVGSADIAVATVPGSGLPAAPMVVAGEAEAESRPAVACGPAGALVVWHDAGRFPSRPAAVRAARLDADGTPHDLGPVSRSERVPEFQPAVAAGPSGHAVAWPELDVAGHTTLLAAALDAAGVASPPVIACDGPGARGGAALSADATGFQLTFADARADTPRLRSARLAAAGAVVDPCGVELPGPGGTSAAAAFDGARHQVAYRRAGTGVVAVAALTPGGGSLDELGVTVAGDGQAAPALACDGRGACLVATERLDAAVGAVRVRVRLVTSDPPAPACAGPADCASGFCVDGVCCDGACGGGDPGDCLACSVAAGAPADGTCAPAAPGRLCRGGTACDTAERCDGTAAACPADATAAEGSSCDDGDACTRSDTCQGGACVGADPVSCTTSDQCSQSTCRPETGFCQSASRPAGSACDDGNACTVEDVCLGSSSRCAGVPKQCPASICHLATCSLVTGACGEVPVADGTGCSDGSACTVEDHCLGGACLAGPAVRCPAPDACHQAGLCDRATGDCVYAARPDGTACDDGDACTRADACRAGACAGNDPVTCPGADACHEAGACDPATGRCGRPPDRPDGTTCDDGNACTRADGCQAGACVGGDPVTCPAATACAEAGLCDPATGRCAAAWRPAGTACDDGDACTLGDACGGGTCRPGTAPACPPSADPCQVATCASATGACGTTPTPDGTACPGGTCQGGACQLAKASGGCASGGGAGWLGLLATAALGLSRPGRRRAVRPSASSP